MVTQSIRPIRIVLGWLVAVTGILTLASAFVWGVHGAVSAALGGGVNLVAGGVYGWRVSRGEARTAGEAIATLFRAWGIKILLIVVQLVLVLRFYKDLVHAAFLAAFVITVAVFASAVAVRERNG